MQEENKVEEAQDDDINQEQEIIKVSKNEQSIDELNLMKQRESQLLLRLADCENTIKRLRNDIIIESDRSVIKFAKELISTFENIFFGIKQLEGKALSEESKNIFDGMIMIQKQLLSLFEKFSITKTEPKSGEKFDPSIHEAISHVPSDLPPNSVIDCIRPGFVLKNTILKAASVVISKDKSNE